MVLLPDNWTEYECTAHIDRARKAGVDYTVFKPYTRNPLSPGAIDLNLQLRRNALGSPAEANWINIAALSTKRHNVVVRTNALTRRDSGTRGFGWCRSALMAQKVVENRNNAVLLHCKGRSDK